MPTTVAPLDPALELALAELRAGSERWAALDALDRARVLIDTYAATGAVAREWAETAALAKGLDPESTPAAEEWFTGPYGVLDALDAYASSFINLVTRGSTLVGARFRSAPGGRVALRILPEDLPQWVLLNGLTADVWMPPGVTEAQVRDEAGLGAREQGISGGVGLILGAGNISAIGPLDLLYGLVADNRAGILKLNPTFDALLPVYEEALAPLIELGVARIVSGDGAVGGSLATADGIDTVHITGSAATHDRIVWGDGDEAARRRAEGDPRLTKPITSELGGVSPVIVVPGRWSSADIAFQAEHVATMRLHNSGHNCIAAQVLVVSSDWEQRDEFLAAVRGVFDRLPPRAPWYPGSAARMSEVRERHPGAEEHGGRLIVDVESTGDALLSTEVFAPVLAVTELPGTGIDFLQAAIAFANDRLEGSLGANVIIRPGERRAMGTGFDDALVDLRYGTISVNAWTGVGFLLSRGVWGAYPGNTLDAVGSGIGVVHNAHLIAGPERMIVTGAFAPFPRSLLHGECSLLPKPPWFVTSRSALPTARRLTEYAAHPTWARILATLVVAFRA